MKVSRIIELSFLWMASTMGIGTESYSTPATRHLLVGSYSGNLTTLLFDPSKGTIVRSPHNAESYRPAWQTLITSPQGKKYIVSASEGSDTETSGLTVYEVDPNGKLKFTSKTAPGTVVAGPASVAARKDGLIVAAS